MDAVTGGEATPRAGIHLESARMGGVLACAPLVPSRSLRLDISTLGSFSEHKRQNPCPHVQMSKVN